MDSPSDETPPPPRSTLNVWAAAALIALGVLVYFVVVPQSVDDGYGTGRNHPAVGRRPATLSLEALEGPRAGETQDAGSLAGKVVVLNFWAVWCPPCKEELPLLADFAYRMRGESGLAILPVVYDEVPDDTREWLQVAAPKIYKQLGVSITSYYDSQGATHSAVVAQVRESVFPTTVVLDRTGTIRGVWLGYTPRDFQGMQRLVQELLAEKT